ncbi:HAD family hydrolase [Rhodococcus sp. NPDC058639]|uniref:HAD family hydrolase n=1 Tax=Rhodococcus sp. NPDC058639 TaxID=3346570 RepID=UPI00365D1998
MSEHGLRGAIFDVDGVLVDSPHEHAWRESLRDLMLGEWAPIRDSSSWSEDAFTPVVYQEVMSGRPRMEGAGAALRYFGIPDDDEHLHTYADRKQDLLIRLIDDGRFRAYPDALRFVLAIRAAGVPIAAASSSKNAFRFLRAVRMDVFARDEGLDTASIDEGATLSDMFDADLSGRDFARGKPDPEIFLTAAAELGAPAEACVVVEDAVSGIEAAEAGHMLSIGIARADDERGLAEAGADLVVTSLDQVDVARLVRGEPVLRRPETDLA